MSNYVARRHCRCLKIVWPLWTVPESWEIGPIGSLRKDVDVIIDIRSRQFWAFLGIDLRSLVPAITSTSPFDGFTITSHFLRCMACRPGLAFTTTSIKQNKFTTKLWDKTFN